MKKNASGGAALRLALALYDLAWAGATPLLPRLAPRLREGFGQRRLAGFPLERQDVWIQAASGGEAYLAWELLRHLAPGRPLRVLVTSHTSQGLGVLTSAANELAAARPELSVTAAYCPLDRPALMRRAAAAVRPKVVVLLETELWPGLLAACAREGAPVLVLNGRMTGKSLAGYRLWPGLWRALAPAGVLAVSEADAGRYAALFGPERVGRMPNIKFDRAQAALAAASPGPGDSAGQGRLAALAGALPEGAPFVIFGSVRREEEDAVLAAMRLLLARQPQTVIGLFPRHMERLPAWRDRLTAAGLTGVDRSALAAPSRTDAARRQAAPGQIVLWDVFGELGAACSLADGVFVGGSLAPLGGQNFLEPLAAGVIPVSGPSWSNFAWVGEDIVAEGLLRIVETPEELADALGASGRPDRTAVRERLGRYLASRTGGAQKACQRIESHL